MDDQSLKHLTLTISYREMLTSVFGYFLRTINNRFFMKDCVINAMKFVTFDF